MAKLSILIPSYNSARTISKTLMSIYSSADINKFLHEIIVVDDCSTDGTANLLKKDFPTIRLIQNAGNFGAAASRNIGIKNSSGDLLLFIDSDIWLNKAAVSEMIGQANKDTDIFFPKILNEDGSSLYPVLEQEKQSPQLSSCFLITVPATGRCRPRALSRRGP